MKKISIVMLLFASIMLLFSCNNDDGIKKEVEFLPFEWPDTCFTATVIAPEGINNGVSLDFEVKEIPQNKDLRYFIYSAPNEIITKRFVYNVDKIPKGIGNGDKIKFKILSYHIGPVDDSFTTMDRILIFFNILPQ